LFADVKTQYIKARGQQALCHATAHLPDTHESKSVFHLSPYAIEKKRVVDKVFNS
jgi:hypothetical protein